MKTTPDNIIRDMMATLTHPRSHTGNGGLCIRQGQEDQTDIIPQALPVRDLVQITSARQGRLNTKTLPLHYELVNLLQHKLASLHSLQFWRIWRKAAGNEVGIHKMYQ